MSRGFVPAWRKVFEPEHDLAPSMRDPASRLHAWLDLCQMATHKPRSTRHSGVLGIGELVASLRTLGKRWCWSKDRVLRFMSDLEARTRIAPLRETPDGTVYLIVNYASYAICEDNERDSERDANRDRDATAARQEQTQNHKTNYTDAFEELWAVCPRGPKKNAFAQYSKAVPSKVTHDVLLNGWRVTVKAARETQYVPHLFRWIRDERWAEHHGNGTRPADSSVRLPGSAARIDLR